MLLGLIERKDFSESEDSEWFCAEYESYKIDNELIQRIGNKLSDFKTETFIGSWCGDSRREFPRLMKILDELNFEPKNHRIYALDENKSSEQGYEIGKKINRVPIFIFYKKGKEVSRIVETPASVCLEYDILKIVEENPLTPNYFEN